MTTSNIEKSSIDWKEIRRRYEGERCSIRGLAREHNTSDTAIHRRAKLDDWILFSAKSALQLGVQQPEKPTRPWSFETRRDALATALERMRAAVDNAVDSVYCDAMVVQALLFLRAPFADIAKAIEMTESDLEHLFGEMMLRHVETYYDFKRSRGKRRVAA